MSTIPTPILQIVNQVFDMEKKLEKGNAPTSIKRNIRRIKSSLEDMGIHYHNPIGEAYKETRTDVEATISGNFSHRMFITEVIKPIITKREGNLQQIVQNGVVIVEAK